MAGIYHPPEGLGSALWASREPGQMLWEASHGGCSGWPVSALMGQILHEQLLAPDMKTYMGLFFPNTVCGQALSAGVFGGRECRGCMYDYCGVRTLNGQCFKVFISPCF